MNINIDLSQKLLGFSPDIVPGSVHVRLRPDDDGERPVLADHAHLEVVLRLQELVHVARAVDLQTLLNWVKYAGGFDLLIML